MAYLYTFQFHFEHFMFLVIDIFTQLLNEYQYFEKLGYFKKIYTKSISPYQQLRPPFSTISGRVSKRHFSAESRALCVFLYSDSKKKIFIFSFIVQLRYKFWQYLCTKTDRKYTILEYARNSDMYTRILYTLMIMFSKNNIHLTWFNFVYISI